MQTHVVNGLEEARALLRHSSTQRGEGIENIHLESPPYAACHAGVNYYRAFVQQLRSEFPERHFTFTLCCGDDPAIAHDALRLGFTSVRCECSDGMLAQLRAIAKELNATVNLSLSS